MSFEMMAKVVKIKTGSIQMKMILLMLADRANNDGYCFPSLGKIAEDCEVSKSTVSKYLKKLEEAGFIKIVSRFKDGVQLPNHYHITVDESASTIPRDGMGYTVTRYGVYRDTEPEPINEPINEPIREKTSRKIKKFTPPTLKEIEDYIISKNYSVDARKFFDYFEAGSWKDSKGASVKNWKQKVITWENHSNVQKPKNEGVKLWL